MEIIWIWTLIAALVGVCLCWYITDLCKDNKKHCEKTVGWCGLDFISRIGFEFVSIPNADFLTYHCSRIVDDFIAELEFLVPSGEIVVFRTAVRTQREISRKIHLSYESMHQFDIANIPVKLYSNYSGPQLALWEKGKFQYSLFLQKPEPSLMNGLLEIFVRDAACRLKG